jgi:hypothetical protein
MTGLHAAVLQYSALIAAQHGHRAVVCNNLCISSCMPHESDHVTLQLVTVELRFARNVCTRSGVCADGDEKVNVYDKGLVETESVLSW